MKKTILSFAVLLSAAAASAQTVESSKLCDNWFFGIGAGSYVPTTHSNLINDNRLAADVEIGRYITPAFGLELEFQTLFNSNNGMTRSGKIVNKTMFPYFTARKTVVDESNLSLNGLVNFMNLGNKYKGQPRSFELIGRIGFGWLHRYAMAEDADGTHSNYMTGKAGLDFNFNVGEKKALTLSLKPSLTYVNLGDGGDPININHSYISLLAGITYKFKNSNNTHNFALNPYKYTQEEIDALNNKINEQRGKINDQNAVIATDNNTIANLRQQLEECANRKVVNNVTVVKKSTQLAPVVIFEIGKSVVTRAQQPSVQMIATYMKNHPKCIVTIKGYASPEGNAELNKRLSENRANNVKDMLVKTYGISADRLNAVGLGATSEVFSENDWNRVCTFIEDGGDE